MNNNVLQNGSYFYYSDEDQMVYQYSMSKTDKGLQLDVQKWGDFAFLFPDLVNKLIEKKVIYMCSFATYLGTTGTEGPYGERKVFNAEYVASNNSPIELLRELDIAVKMGKETQKKLIKIGDFYE